MSGDISIYKQQNFGGRIGFGAKPGLLIVDFTVAFSDRSVFGGGNIVKAMRNTRPLLDLARQLRMPIAHTRVVYAENGGDSNVQMLKIPSIALLTENNPLSDFVPELMPAPGEIVIRKRLPSAFFGSDLAGMLTSRGVDTLLIAGCTTSGCVRASTLDAMCHGFRPIVVSDCVGDRAAAPHKANLFDLGQKYADVLPAAKIADELAKITAAPEPPPVKYRGSRTRRK
jgi:maleamate amidohydrolase